MNRNDGPASWFIDSTVPSLVYRPVAYSSMISGMDHSHKKQHQTIRKTKAPKILKERIHVHIDTYVCNVVFFSE